MVTDINLIKYVQKLIDKKVGHMYKLGFPDSLIKDGLT